MTPPRRAPSAARARRQARPLRARAVAARAPSRTPELAERKARGGARWLLSIPARPWCSARAGRSSPRSAPRWCSRSCRGRTSRSAPDFISLVPAFWCAAPGAAPRGPRHGWALGCLVNATISARAGLFGARLRRRVSRTSCNLGPDAGACCSCSRLRRRSRLACTWPRAPFRAGRCWPEPDGAALAGRGLAAARSAGTRRRSTTRTLSASPELRCPTRAARFPAATGGGGVGCWSRSRCCSRLSLAAVLRHDAYSARAREPHILVPLPPNRRYPRPQRRGAHQPTYLAYTLEIYPAQVRDLDATIAQLAEFIDIRARSPSKSCCRPRTREPADPHASRTRKSRALPPTAGG